MEKDVSLDPQVEPFALHDAFVARHGTARVMEAARPFLTEARVTRIETMLRGRLSSVQVAVERPQDPHNAAAVVRTAEALGCTDVHVVGAEEGILHARGATQGAFHWVDTHHRSALCELVDTLAKTGTRLWGATMAGDHTPHSLPVDGPVCILLGNETHGLSEEALATCHGTVRIEMFGMGESLNLSVSAGMLLHTLAHRRRALLGSTGDLDSAALELRRARAYARSVEPRLLAALLD